MVIEKLTDPNYVQAVENFFNLTGVARRKSAYCEPQSHNLNKKFPLVIQNTTRDKLVDLNEIDNKLYAEMSGCLDSLAKFDFIPWDESRFSTTHTQRMGRLN